MSYVELLHQACKAANKGRWWFTVQTLKLACQIAPSNDWYRICALIAFFGALYHTEEA